MLAGGLDRSVPGSRAGRFRVQIVWPHPPCPQCRLLYTSLHDRMGQRRIVPSLGVQLRGAGKTSPQTTAGLLEVVGVNRRPWSCLGGGGAGAGGAAPQRESGEGRLEAGGRWGHSFGPTSGKREASGGQLMQARASPHAWHSQGPENKGSYCYYNIFIRTF